MYLCLMQRISIHIERLLLANDCVIIPEVGGFVLHPYPAVYESAEHKFCPPYKGIVFNPTLNHQDKLLPESYIQTYGLTLKKAEIALKKDIEELSKKIDKEGKVYVEKIGFLRKDDAGKLFFEPDRDSSLLGLKPYGLYPFHLPPVVRDERKEMPATVKSKKTKTKLYLPVNRVFMRVIGASVAVIGLFLFVSMPVNDVGRSTCIASFVPSEIVSKSVNLPIIPADTMQESGIEAGVIETSVAKEIIRPVVAVKQPAAQTEASTHKIYYAIIGSFVTEHRANQYLSEINIPELTNPGIVINDGRVRVYAEKFDRKEDAVNYIQLLKKNEKLKDTWLYVGSTPPQPSPQERE